MTKEDAAKVARELEGKTIAKVEIWEGCGPLGDRGEDDCNGWWHHTGFRWIEFTDGARMYFDHWVGDSGDGYDEIGLNLRIWPPKEGISGQRRKDSFC